MLDGTSGVVRLLPNRLEWISDVAAKARAQVTALTGAMLAAAIVVIFISLHLGHCSRPRLERCILHHAVRRALTSQPSPARDAHLRLQLQLSLSSSRPLLSPSA